MNIFKVTSAILASLALIACGGGGGGGGGTTAGDTRLISTANVAEQVVLLAGTGTTVEGTVETAKNLLKSVAWQVSALSPTDPDLTLKNQACEVVTKQDVPDPILPGGGIGRSSWTCGLGVVSSSDLKADAVYKLSLVGTDSAGGSTTFTKYLLVKPNPNFAETATSKLNVAITGSLVGKPGQTLSLGAVAEWTDVSGGSTPVIFSWSLGAGSEKFASLLSNTGSNVQLYLAPGTTAPTLIPIAVTATGNGVSTSASMFALVDPSKLNVAIIGGLSGKPGQTLNLGAVAEWTDATAATRTPVIFSWALGSASAGAASLLTNTGSNVQLYLSPEQTTSTLVPVTVTATGNGVSTSSTVYALIDPSKLNVAIVGGLVGKPGQTLNLGALAEWADTKGENQTPVVYSWSVAAGSEGFAKLLSNTGSNVQLYLAPGQTTPVQIPVTVTAKGDGVSASSTMIALIDPFEPLGPSVSPAVQDVLPNHQVCIRALDIDIADPNLFYKWSVEKINDAFATPEQQKAIPLGGENTLNLGFFAPATPQLMTIRFAVGYYPITDQYKGVYFVDALVRVTNTPTANVFEPLAYCR